MSIIYIVLLAVIWALSTKVYDKGIDSVRTHIKELIEYKGYDIFNEELVNKKIIDHIDPKFMKCLFPFNIIHYFNITKLSKSYDSLIYILELSKAIVITPEFERIREYMDECPLDDERKALRVNNFDSVITYQFNDGSFTFLNNNGVVTCSSFSGEMEEVVKKIFISAEEMNIVDVLVTDYLGYSMFRTIKEDEFNLVIVPFSCKDVVRLLDSEISVKDLIKITNKKSDELTLSL